jgi:hypothetical protein
VDRNANHPFWNLAVGSHVTAIVFRHGGSARNLCGAATDGAAVSYTVSPVVFRDAFLCGAVSADSNNGATSKLKRRAGKATSKALVVHFLPFA